MKKSKIVLIVFIILIIPTIAFSEDLSIREYYYSRVDNPRQIQKEAPKVVESATDDDYILKLVNADIKRDRDTVYVDDRSAEFDFIYPGISKRGGLYICRVNFKGGGNSYDIDYYVEKGPGIVKKVFFRKNDQIINRAIWTKETGKLTHKTNFDIIADNIDRR